VVGPSGAKRRHWRQGLIGAGDSRAIHFPMLYQFLASPLSPGLYTRPIFLGPQPREELRWRGADPLKSLTPRWNIKGNMRISLASCDAPLLYTGRKRLGLALRFSTSELMATHQRPISTVTSRSMTFHSPAPFFITRATTIAAPLKDDLISRLCLDEGETR
jgi:hypothetical protein